MRENYRLPLNCGALMQKNPKLPRVSLEDSVRRHLYLILITRFDANRCFPSYGCELWEHDFENLKALDSKKHHFEQSIKALLTKHEPRLGETQVKIEIKEEPYQDPLRLTQKITKKIDIKIKGRLLETNKVFEPKAFIIFFTPIALDGNHNLK